MLPGRSRAAADEPASKRLRISNQKAGSIHQLPSPDPAPGSSSENAGHPPSISPKRKLSQSFRDRIFNRSNETPVEAPKPLPKQQELRPKISIVPIFKQTMAAAFQATPEPSYRDPATHKEPDREPSPESDPEEMIKRLRKHYLDSAETVHERAKIQLQNAHSEVTRKFREAMQGEEVFLAKMERQNRTLCAPMESFSIRSQQEDPVDASIHTETTDTVGDLVSNVERQVMEFEAELAKLWEQLEGADAEVARVYRESLAGGRGAQESDEEAAQLAETLTQLWTAIKKQILEAEEEIAMLSGSAVAAMKEVEKDFRKATLPDLHIFFQSIDEP
ncbi:hypothetical protein QBC34DRAFT_475771 [Podospora aff. communis PSN243]|uniref:Uncharacterized protein n=1 Tax=Podospora aff. communis PSN243 TaxID=3040156 RepID=A0AAV9H2B9_9PEZI|nr:hypothetical protein QBC34DRAFT_475771 [Podospora aff. communis PSN243]